MRINLRAGIVLSGLCLLLTGVHSVAADIDAPQSGFDGSWTINAELSDDTDRQVEKAIIESGGRATRGGKGRYKGGPKEHALYDHISYDEVLHFRYDEPEFRLTYADNFERIFHSDNRSRTVSASGTSSDDRQDFSFASWDGDKLLVESRVRDGGWILETWSLQSEGNQLSIKMELQPSSFTVPVYLNRVYDRSLQD